MVEFLKQIEINDIIQWVMNFYPLNFFGYNVPIILLIAGIWLVVAVIGATLKTLIKVVIVVLVIYIISYVLGIL